MIIIKAGDKFLKQKVYTIGYDARDWDDFIKIILTNNIRVIVDVRRFPQSKFVRYSKMVLEKILPMYNVSYYWLGKLLGGFRGNYIKYMRTKEYQRGIELLQEIIRSITNGYVALMCRERIPWRCHRRFIASTLLEKGFEVYHIIDYGYIVKYTMIG